MSAVDLAKVLKLCEASTGNGVPYHDMRRLANDLQWHAIQLADEVERLREALDLYGNHTDECRVGRYPHGHLGCNCGFRAALRMEEAEDE